MHKTRKLIKFYVAIFRREITEYEIRSRRTGFVSNLWHLTYIITGRGTSRLWPQLLSTKLMSSSGPDPTILQITIKILASATTYNLYYISARVRLSPNENINITLQIWT